MKMKVIGLRVGHWVIHRYRKIQAISSHPPTAPPQTQTAMDQFFRLYVFLHKICQSFGMAVAKGFAQPPFPSSLLPRPAQGILDSAGVGSATMQTI